MSSKYLFALACCLAVSLPAYAQKGNPARGAEVFQKMNCNMCHPGGNNALEPQKPLHGAAFAKKYATDEAIARRIREGSENGRMPSFPKSQLTDQELADVISYVRSLTPAAKSAAKAVPTKQPVIPAVKCAPNSKKATAPAHK